MKKIAVVEDEELLRDEICNMLDEVSYESIKIDDFSRTSEELLDINPDLILLDINLPNENGFSICRTIKSMSSIPILILTSRDKLEDELKALKIGADEYITKPFRKERLLARVSNLIKRYE